jgi:hypothetical protein
MNWNFVYVLNKKLHTETIKGADSYDEAYNQLLADKGIQISNVQGAYSDDAELFECSFADKPHDLVVLVADGKLVWDDPDPIDDNNYIVDYLRIDEGGDTGFIVYGPGSEAEINISELSIVD